MSEWDTIRLPRASLTFQKVVDRGERKYMVIDAILATFAEIECHLGIYSTFMTEGGLGINNPLPIGIKWSNRTFSVYAFKHKDYKSVRFEIRGHPKEAPIFYDIIIENEKDGQAKPTLLTIDEFTNHVSIIRQYGAYLHVKMQEIRKMNKSWNGQKVTISI